MKISSNKTFFGGAEISYLSELVASGDIGSDGRYTRLCAQLLEDRYSVAKVLITPSGTAALEMAAMLCELKSGDEVIMPSFTFASTANAVVRLGARPVFVDIRPDTLNLDEELVERSITSRTRAIFPVHYGGVACEMDQLLEVAARHGLFVVEDAAQGVNASYWNRALGSIGSLAAYSFHYTKNYACGEGGALCINSPEMVERAEIIREKGTNRSKFVRGEVDRYTWVDIGSSYIPSELVCAFLYAQLEMIEWSTVRRKRISRLYDDQLQPLESEGLLTLPVIPSHCESNYHLYWLLVSDAPTRDALLRHLQKAGVGASTHYVPLHSSPMGKSLGCHEHELSVTDYVSDRLLRLPVHPELSESEQLYVVRTLTQFLERSGKGSRRSLDGTTG